MGDNMKPFNDKYCMDEKSVYATSKCMCENNEDVIKVCMQERKLVDMRDKCVDGVLNRGKSSEIIECICVRVTFYHWTC